jgi:hypothetical protein
MKPLLFLITALTLSAIDGVVLNQTTGKPGAEVPIVLMRLGDGGMMPVGTIKSGPDGKFEFKQALDGPYLMQATFDGVTYNKLLQPGAPGTGLTIEVFASSSQPSQTQVAQHMMLVEPLDGKLTINETVIFKNDGKTSFVDEKNGTYRFFIPDAAKDSLNVRVAGPGNMPVKRDATPAGAPGVYKVDYPIKPGESRFDIQYSLPFTPPGKFKGRILHPVSATIGQTRLVTPNGVKLSGDGLEDLGAEPQTQAEVYTLTKQDFEFEITGTGSLRSLEPDEDASPSPTPIPPKIAERMPYILALAFIALGFGFVMLWRRDAPKA